MSLRCRSISRRLTARQPRTRRTADVALRVALTAGRSVTVIAPLLSSRGAKRRGMTRENGLDEVHDREQQDPHEVDEVPVQAQCLDPEVVLLGVLAEEQLARA